MSLLTLSDKPPPKIIDAVGVPEIYCEVSLVRPLAETVRILLARESLLHQGSLELVGILHMPLSGWRQSHCWAHDILAAQIAH